MKGKACVIGSGPNGLSAAIVLAQAGLEVQVFETQPIPGGGARSMELTLPGFLHDFGSAVHPLAAGSPFFSSLPLHEYGLEWIHSPAPLAHPLDDGTAVLLERKLDDARASLGVDGETWCRLLRPYVEHWKAFAPEVLRPQPAIPKHPWLMARFGMTAFASAERIAGRFQSERTRALFAGLAAHSFLSFDEVLSGALGMLMAIPAHAVGWPIPRGGSQAITNALCGYLEKLGGAVHTSRRIDSLEGLPKCDLVLCDVTPRQLLAIAGSRLASYYKRRLQAFRYGPGVFKVDYALREPIPWRASECKQAITLHLGGPFEQIAASEKAVRSGKHSEKPFVLLAQHSLYDTSRAPAGKHTAWAYCHVPNGSTENMLSKIEEQIERFAPGFREIVLARRTLSCAELEVMNANLVGGDINGGVLDLRQFLARPTWQQYATSARDIYICSASTPPGGAVHGMCGYHAAKMALRRFAAA